MDGRCSGPAAGHDSRHQRRERCRRRRQQLPARHARATRGIRAETRRIPHEQRLLLRRRPQRTDADQRLSVGEISAEALTNIAQVTWVTDANLAGGRLAFSGVLPYGNLEVGGNVVVPVAPFKVEQSDELTALGDAALSAVLGWKHRDGDKFRAWSTYSTLFVPIGDYEVGRLANMGKNRWALDLGGAYTMANFKGGREFSAVLGFTLNGENDDTNYDSGHEMHLELAGKQYLPNHFSMGIVGYWNEQLTADEGGPAILGDFKGRVFGIGPEVVLSVHPKQDAPGDARPALVPRVRRQESRRR
ncbi:MAG: transporter [Proteobacteria bacterium]|nr:transporter [Pseudomonadota bacterium]